MNETIWPNLIIPGAGRSGKMALCTYLNKHEDVFIPTPIEPNFFAYYNLDTHYKSNDSLFYDNIIKTKDHYNDIFSDGIKYKIRLDASGSYLLFADKTIYEMANLIPEYKKIKIIIMLRNPVERALSAYTHYAMHKFEELSPDKAIAEETIKKRLMDNWSPNYDYISGSFYSDNVKKYLKVFNDVKIVLSEDLKYRREDTLSNIYEFLDLPINVEIDVDATINPSGVSKNKWFHDILYNNSNIIRQSIRPIIRQLLSENKRNSLKSYLRNKNLKQTEMSELLQNRLMRNFKDDILKLEKIIEKDLSHWL